MENSSILNAKAVIAGFVGALTSLWGWFGWLVFVWAILMLADWLIGTLLLHIPGVTLPFEYSVLLGPLVIVWYILGELGSLAEHAVSMGAKVPSWLPRILDISKDAVDAAAETIAHEHVKTEEESK